MLTAAARGLPEGPEGGTAELLFLQPPVLQGSALLLGLRGRALYRTV